MAGEGNLGRERGPEIVGSADFAFSGEVPLVGDQYEALALGVHERSDARVLARGALFGVDDEQRHVALLDPLAGLDHRQHLGALFGLSLPPDARRVHEPEPPALRLEKNVHRVARGAGDLRDDRTLLAEEGIDEGRFADVRAADDCERDLVAGVGSLAGLARQPPADRVLQVVHAGAVLGGHAVDFGKAERPRLGLSFQPLATVDLVRDDDALAAGLADDARRRPVTGQDPGRRIDDEQHEVRLPDRRDGLLAYGRGDFCRAPRDRSRRCPRGGTSVRRSAALPPRERPGSFRACHGRSTGGGGSAG